MLKKTNKDNKTFVMRKNSNNIIFAKGLPAYKPCTRDLAFGIYLSKAFYLRYGW